MIRLSLKGIITTAFALLALLIFDPGYATTPFHVNSQPAVIRILINREQNIQHAKNIINIVKQIDDVYRHLHADLSRGDRITIFFDPAHGKLKNGYWEGEVTRRISCTGYPEEYYSIMIARQLYRLLTKNRYIDVKSTKDFLAVMKGESDTYKNIPFTTTVKLAKKEKAFIIISEHLNNISTIHKASGLINLPGIHITYNKWGWRYLTYIKNTYKGFLTLYNKLDTTGFSHAYALQLRKKLVTQGIRANNWEFGSVADDRFSYFIDFPISVIFESGFISNPEEEARLRNPEYQKVLAEAQYRSFIDTVNKIFGIDISDNKQATRSARRQCSITLIKLSRMALYYINNSEPEKGIIVINEMYHRYKSKYRKHLKPYLEIKALLTRANSSFKKGKKLITAKRPRGKKRRRAYWRNYRRGKKLIRIALRTLKKKTLFCNLREEYSDEYKKLIGYKTKKKHHSRKLVRTLQKRERVYPIPIRRASLTTPIILAI
jgi:N-acetylmuramoyl-L-alanine amidase